MFQQSPILRGKGITWKNWRTFTLTESHFRRRYSFQRRKRARSIFKSTRLLSLTRPTFLESSRHGPLSGASSVSRANAIRKAPAAQLWQCRTRKLCLAHFLKIPNLIRDCRRAAAPNRLKNHRLRLAPFGPFYYTSPSELDR